MNEYTFPCGCTFKVKGKRGHYPLLEYDTYKVPFTCQATWDLISRGDTIGIFQLESGLGKRWAKALKPENIEHLAALGAILRPGCVSGNTNIAMSQVPRNGRERNRKTMTMRELYRKYHSTPHHRRRLISVNEQNFEFFRNDIVNVFFSGNKRVFKPLFKLRTRSDASSTKFYSLECTDDHKLFVHGRGWVELKDVHVGDRVAVANQQKKLRPIKKAPGEKSFRDICLNHYEYRCVMCDWDKGSLDVNHLEGNRTTDNSCGNLCFLCPNHHREYTENSLSKETIIKERAKYTLPQSSSIQWAIYTGKEDLGIQDTYDITVQGPNHNFMAGNVLVHNCLRCLDEDGVSMTEHYCNRKNSDDEFHAFHPAVEKALASTYGILVFQEQALLIAADVARFSLEEADLLRRAIGKKKTDEMAKVEQEFIKKTVEVGEWSEEDAKEIFGHIKASQRYAFNKAHSASYGERGYYTAYIKAHFPTAFYYSWLTYTKDKQDTQDRIDQLYLDAQKHHVKIKIPDLRDKQKDFYIKGQRTIYFGLTNVKGIGESKLDKFLQVIADTETYLGKSLKALSYYEFLVHVMYEAGTDMIEPLIFSGSLDWFGIERQRILHDTTSLKEILHTKTAREWLIENRDDITNLDDLFTKAIKLKKEGGAAATNPTLKNMMSAHKLYLKPPHSITDEPYILANKEEYCLGVPITYDKVSSCDMDAANTSCSQVLQASENKILSVAGEICNTYYTKTKRGKTAGAEMAIFSLRDKTGILESICAFPEVYAKYNQLISDGQLVVVTGKRSKDSFLISDMAYAT